MEFFENLIINNLEYIGIPEDNLYYFKFLNRFKNNLIVYGNSDCWNWVGSTSGRKDYGLISFTNKALGIDTNFQTHRLSYTLFVGNIPDDLVIRHKCNNSLCANPKHLILGTLKDNTLDMVLSQRAGNSTSDTQKLEMVEMRNAGLELKEIAANFNVSISCVSRILGGKRKTVHLGIGVHEKSYQTSRNKPPKTTKLSEFQVLEIVNFWNTGKSMAWISEKYKVFRTTISDIINKKTWKYLTKNLEIRKYIQIKTQCNL